MTEQTAAIPVYDNPVLRFFAKLISYIFHPLFIPVYFFFWTTKRFPYEFSGLTPTGLNLKTISVFWMTGFFPAFSVFLLWRLKFIDSIFLKTQKERIVPYIISMFFYWWMYYLSRNFSDQAIALKFFFFGIFICTVVALIANNFLKISMHAMGAGGAMMALILTCMLYRIHLGADISVCIILTGLVCTSRFLVSDHTNTEIYSGLITGMFCQWTAYMIMF
ncbi:MAG: hypothetical protein JWN76_1723 [Chitinophagaceae bacterium]|nr:hypothetical protein [Chitinophagaceae bacterium]